MTTSLNEQRLSLVGAIANGCQGDISHPAFIQNDGSTVSYADVLTTAETITSALRALGVTDLDHVAFSVPRSPLGIIGFLGISGAAICCPLNPRLKEIEYEGFFQTVRPNLLVAASPSGADLAAARQGIPVATLAPDGRLSLQTDGEFQTAATADRGERYALFLRTSGTTGMAKNVLLTHSNILAAGTTIQQAFDLGTQDLCLNLMPTHHVHGLISAGISSLIAGSAAICAESFSVESFNEIFEQWQPTWFTGSPAMHIALREYYRQRGSRPNNPRLRFFRSSSAPLPASVIGDLEEQFQAPLIETYGLTETASMICTNPLPPAVRKLGSVGLARGAEMKIVDDDGQEVAVGTTGEIVVRGPSVINQYGAPTLKGGDAFFDDWLRTGDLGSVDKDGYFFITGRRKELIKRGGMSVYPVEVDNVILMDQRVSEVVTFSVPHPTLGEEVVSAVVVSESKAVTGRDLRDPLFDKLSSYKIPAEIYVVDSLPKTEAGKINRIDLAAELSHLFEPAQVPPNSRLETDLLKAWRKALDRDDIGVTDNLFVFGADPLRAVQVGNDVPNPDGKTLTASRAFRCPTIREQAEILARTA